MNGRKLAYLPNSFIISDESRIFVLLQRLPSKIGGAKQDHNHIMAVGIPNEL